MITHPYKWQKHEWLAFIKSIKNNDTSSYLIQGEKGTGVNYFCILAIKYIFCNYKSDNLPCSVCQNCNKVDSDNLPDLHILDGKDSMINIDSIREVCLAINNTSHGKSKKIIYINNITNLNIYSSNALLKTLEEPPNNTLIILRHEVNSIVLDTIKSRCFKVHLPRSNLQDTLDLLQEYKFDNDKFIHFLAIQLQLNLVNINEFTKNELLLNIKLVINLVLTYDFQQSINVIINEEIKDIIDIFYLVSVILVKMKLKVINNDIISNFKDNNDISISLYRIFNFSDNIIKLKKDIIINNTLKKELMLFNIVKMLQQLRE